MKVNVQYAETHLADLISAASRGEIVEIDTPDAVACISASPKPNGNGSVAEPATTQKGSRAHLFGAWEGMFPTPTDEEWRAMDKEIENEMVNAPLAREEHG